jgi:hypothetical protein
MPRPRGSKIFSCPKCAERVVALPGEYGTCKACGTKTKLTKTLLAAQTPIARTASAPKKAPTPAPEPPKRGRKPTPQVETVEEPKKRGRKPSVQVEIPEEPKRRGRPPISKLDVSDEPVKRGRKPAQVTVEEPAAPKKRGRPAGQKAAPVIQNPKGMVRPPKRAASR